MYFIVFEGGEGVGKTTQINLLFEKWQASHVPCLKTREPGGTPLGEKIRDLFKAKDEKATPLPLTDLYLLSAARHEHVERVIKPALQEGKIVLCDRFLDSTYVYQHYLNKLEKSVVDDISFRAMKDLTPHLTFVFYTTSLTSLLQRQTLETHRQEDRFDSKGLAFHEELNLSYQRLVSEGLPYPSGVVPKRVLIEASRSKELIFEDICNALKVLGLRF
jgi:dTMP kinase